MDISKLERLVKEKRAYADVPVAMIDGKPMSLKDMLSYWKRGLYVLQIKQALRALGMGDQALI